MKAKVDALRVPTMSASEGRGLDWTKAQKVAFPDLKPSTETISLRMPAPLLHAIKREANRRDVPYQSLIKVVLAERFAAAQA
ncbi:MAG: CopG family antitoxin [Chthoniobacterales bacterium]